MTQMAVLRQNQGNMVSGQMPNISSLPPDLQQLVDAMQPMVQQFRNVSSPLYVLPDPQVLTIGKTTSFRIQSTGLGTRMLHTVKGSIALVNGAGAAQAISFSKEFPYSLLPNVNTSINGNTSITNASAFAYLMEMVRRYRNININPMSARLCSVTAGANITLTAGANTLSGYSGASIAASSTGIINFTFSFEVPYTLNRSTMIGALPLQNASTYAQVVYTTPTAIMGTDAGSPIYVAGAIPGTLTYSPALSSYNVNERYDFWGVPDNAAYYQEFILNSFQVIEQTANILSSTGAGAFKFQFPLNSYLLANTVILRDSSNNLVNVNNVVQNLYQQYNSNMTPFKSDLANHEFDQYLFYNNDWSQYGVVLWDGMASSDVINQADNAAWVDLYNTSNPTFIMDIITGAITLPATYSMVRVQIVPSDVQVVPA